MAEGSITEQEYMDKLEHFVRLRTRQVEDSNIQPYLRQFFDAAAVNYKDSSRKKQCENNRQINVRNGTITYLQKAVCFKSSVYL